MSQRLIVDGRVVELGCETDLSTPLVHVLKTQAHCQSVKVGCSEGGCGACAVQVWYTDEQGTTRLKSVNSCLTPVGSVLGKHAIVTACGLGNHKDGYDIVQERIAGFFATQCGFCTPGVAVACHTAIHQELAAGKAPSASSLPTHALSGNLCRCTGYRPIVDACKSMCGDADVEDLGIYCAAADTLPSALTPPHPDTARIAQSHTEMAGRMTALLADAPIATCSLTHGRAGAKSWHRPATLPALLQALAEGGAPAHIVAGNTGAGVYKDWPDTPVLIDVRGVDALTGAVWGVHGGLRLGGGCTLDELATALSSDDAPLDAKPMARRLSTHLRRIAGVHVQHAATVGGNLALARGRGLESDLVTPLLALGAVVEVASPAAPECITMPLADYLEAAHDAHQVVVAVHVPAVHGAEFWVYKLSERYTNSSSLVNAAIMVDPHSTPHVALGMRTTHGWHCSRVTAVEAALAGSSTSPDDLQQALRAVQDLAASAGASQPVQRMTQGIMLKGLAAVLRNTFITSPSLRALTDDVDWLHGVVPEPSKGSQRVAIDPSCALQPVGAVVQKEKSLLQASGEATFTGDLPTGVDALYGAFVTSTVARGAVEAIDPSRALALHGVVRVLTPADIPGANAVGGSFLPIDCEPLFAETVSYHGQPVALVLATSQVGAERGARLVGVRYRPTEAPVLDIDDAKAQGLIHSLSFMGPLGDWTIKKGDVEAAIATAPHTVSGTFHLPSLQHMYMEPQVTVARPRDGGGLWVATASQSPSSAHVAAANVLGVPQHHSTVETGRLGGGFGGKASRSLPAMLAACVGSAVTGRECRVEVNRNVDMRMTGGRNATRVAYTAAFDESGVVSAIKLRVDMLGSVFIDITYIDTNGLKNELDSCYAVPAWDVEIVLTKCNIHPLTAMRSPGHTQGAYITQYIMHKVAEALGVDEALVHEANMLAKKHLVTNEAGERLYKTPAVDFVVPEEMYTAPHIWKLLKESSRYEARRAEVDAFNAANVWRKRGLSIMPTRFVPFLLGHAAGVSVFMDGSVLVHHSGVDMGQGISTKVKQVAALELGRVLPAGTHIPLASITTSPCNTTTLANHTMAAGSSTSESASQAVRLACETIVERLQPFAARLADAGKDVTWTALIGSAFMASWMPPLTQLQAIAQYDGSAVGGAPGERLRYCTYGAAVSEVELDVLTGERWIVRSDVLFDVGRSMNPGVDVGQIEGAFVMGCGMAMTEEALHDNKGVLINDSTWNYKIPSSTCIPRELNVQLLENSDNARGIYSSKACGEPPLQLSASVMTAMRDATRAARDQLQALGKGESNGPANGAREVGLPDWGPPATLTRLHTVLGGVALCDILR